MAWFRLSQWASAGGRARPRVGAWLHSWAGASVYAGMRQGGLAGREFAAFLLIT